MERGPGPRPAHVAHEEDGTDALGQRLEQVAVARRLQIGRQLVLQVPPLLRRRKTRKVSADWAIKEGAAARTGDTSLKEKSLAYITIMLPSSSSLFLHCGPLAVREAGARGRAKERYRRIELGVALRFVLDGVVEEPGERLFGIIQNCSGGQRAVREVWNHFRNALS